MVIAWFDNFMSLFSSKGFVIFVNPFYKKFSKMYFKITIADNLLKLKFLRNLDVFIIIIIIIIILLLLFYYYYFITQGIHDPSGVRY